MQLAKRLSFAIPIKWSKSAATIVKVKNKQD